MSGPDRIELHAFNDLQREELDAIQARRMVVIPIEALDETDPLVEYSEARRLERLVDAWWAGKDVLAMIRQE